MSFASSRDQALWGAKRIANYIGATEEMVYGLATRPDCPIYKPSGKYFAYRHELDRWLRTKPGAEESAAKDLPEFRKLPIWPVEATP